MARTRLFFASQLSDYMHFDLTIYVSMCLQFAIKIKTNIYVEVDERKFEMRRCAYQRL